MRIKGKLGEYVHTLPQTFRHGRQISNF